MDALEAIQKRRSIRHYKPDDIPEDVLERLLNAMRLAPSGKNCQPWKFIVVRDNWISIWRLPSIISRWRQPQKAWGRAGSAGWMSHK